MTIGLWYRL